MKDLSLKSEPLNKTRVRELFLLLFLAFVTLGLYYPAILGSLSLMDDRILSEHVLNNPSYDFIPKGIYARPLSTIVFYGISRVFGFDGPPYHFFNVLVHIGSGLLIYYMVKTIYQEAGEKLWLAFIAATIFLVHPLNVEAVAWVSGRPTVMATFFILLAFFFHLKVRKDLKDYRLWVAAFSYLLSMLSYEFAAAMPLAFFFWDLQQDSGDNWRQRVKSCYPRWIPYGLSFLAYFSFRLLPLWTASKNVSEGTEGSLFLRLFGIWENFLSSFSSPFVAIGFYLKKVFCPWPLNLYIFQVSPTIRPLYLILGVAFLLALGWCIWKRHWLQFWGFWFICGLLVILPLSFHSFSWTGAAERYVYLSSVAFAVSISLFVLNFLMTKDQWLGRFGLALVVIMIFVFGLGTSMRAKVWQSDLALLEDTWRKSPESGKVNDAYARILWSKGRTDEAIFCWRKAIDLGRISAPSRFLGHIEKDKGNYAEAEKYYLQAQWPKQEFGKEGPKRVTDIGILRNRDPDTYVLLANLHAKWAAEEPEREEYHQARIIHFHEAACEAASKKTFYKYLLAKAYLRYGHVEKAREHFVEVSEAAPDTYYGKAAAKLAKANKIGPKKKRVEFPEFIQERRNNGQGG
jgi:tetratricopeptide (TPR) repeat protein